MEQRKELNFEGQNIYSGIDTHAEQWTVCVRDEEFELKKFTHPPEPAKLAAYLKRTYPGATYYAVYEAGFCGFWIQRQLQAAGINCIVAHPADVPTTDKEKDQKSDARDCRKLAQELCNKRLEAIYIPSEQMTADRHLLRTRKQLVKDQTRNKNRIQSMLHFEGIKIPEGYKQSTHFSKRFINWLEGSEMKESAKEALQIKLDMLKKVREQLLRANRHMRKLSCEERYKNPVQLLRSIPGVGIINAMVLITEVGDFKRFESFASLCNYFGLVPSIYQSDKTLKVRGITYRCNHLLRETLVESSWQVIRHDPALLMCYKTLCKRMEPNKAIIRIARKLLRRIRHVMLTETEYVIAVVK